MLIKLKKYILKIVLIFLAIFIAVIIFNGIFFYEDYGNVLFTYNPIFLIITVMGYCIFISLVYKYIIPKIEKSKLIVYILLILFTVLCIFSGNYFKLNPSWDMGAVFSIAKDYVLDNKTENLYLYTFPNNIMLVGIYQAIFSFFYMLKNTDFLTIATIFNSLLVAFTGILLYYNTNIIFGKRKALMILIITIITVPLYLYSACYYSDTISMFFTMLMVTVYLKTKNKDSKIIEQEQKINAKKIVLQILFGIILFLGIKIKITSIFIFIALIIYDILICKFNIKNILKEFKFSFMILILLYFLFNVFIEPLYIPDKQLLETNKIPTEHWIMMGLKGKGGFSTDEYLYTQSFETFQEKKEANRKVIKERIYDLFFNKTLFEHLKQKIIYGLCDGTYFSPEVLRREPVKYRILHEVVLSKGKNTQIYKYWPQSMHFGMLIFILINVYKTLKDKEYNAKDNVLFIAVLGIMVFLLMWENRSRYLITMLPIIMMSQLGGIEYLAKKKGEKNEKNISCYTNVLRRRSS
ncbi:MAG: hypothetical protein IJH39_00785 [Clostridia bacterium]|nr:hypothetical protein [Clostridia bacterium]